MLDSVPSKSSPVSQKGPGGGGGYFLYGLNVQPKRVWFTAILVIHVSRVCFLHSSLDMGRFLERKLHFFIIEKKINTSHSQIIFMVIQFLT